jgi:peroxiredoxin
MHTLWKSALWAVLCSAALSAQGEDKKPAEKPAAPESKPAAKATVDVGDRVDASTKYRDWDGKEAKFGDHAGKVVVVVFDSIKCPTNTWTEERFKAMHAAWEKEGGVVFLMFNANRGEIGKDPYAGGAKPTEPTYVALREHWKKHEVKYPLHPDHGNVLADLFQAKKTPHCFVLDKDLVVRYAGALDDDSRGDKKTADTVNYVQAAVEAVKKGEKPKIDSKPAYG